MYYVAGWLRKIGDRKVSYHFWDIENLWFRSHETVENLGSYVL
jgi:hypothetical protein